MNVVVVPARNEETKIEDVIRRAESFVDTVIVVDDGSTDKTHERAVNVSSKVVALRHEVNLGKGASLKTGCEAAMRLGADRIVCMDGDGQHDPQSIHRFIEAIANDNVDIVFGARPFNSKMPLVSFIGNRFLSIMINLFFHYFLQDSQCGFRAFTREAYEKIRWESTGYEVETEMIVRASQHHLRYKEIDIDTIYHDSYKGTTIIDGMKIFLTILKWKML